MKKKKLRLKGWVKDTFVIICFSVLFVLLLLVGCERYDEVAQECDNYYGYTCSNYQVEQYAKGIRR